jgi:hypothetical protein
MRADAIGEQLQIHSSRPPLSRTVEMVEEVKGSQIYN